jgi:hypothetical protein
LLFTYHYYYYYSYESITFDAYTCLSLPLPVDTKRRLDVIYRPLPYGSVPIKFTCTLPIDATVKDIKVWLHSTLAAAATAEARKADVSSDVTVSGESPAAPTAAQRLPQAPPLARMIAFEAHLHRVYKKISDSHPICEIKDDDVIGVCEVEHEHTPAPVVLRLGSGASLYKPVAVKTVVKPEVKVEVKPEVKPEVKTEVKTEANAEVDTEEESTAAAAAVAAPAAMQIEVKPEVETEIKSEEADTETAAAAAVAPVAVAPKPVKVHEVDILQSKPSSNRLISATLFGLPARISYAEGTTNKQMHEIVRQHVARYFKEQLPPVGAAAAAAAAVPADIAAAAVDAALTAGEAAAAAAAAADSSADAQMSADVAAVLGTAAEPAATDATAATSSDADTAADMQVDSSTAATPTAAAAAASDATVDSTAATPAARGTDSMDVSAAASTAGALIPYVPPETDPAINAAFKAAAAALAAAAAAHAETDSSNKLYKLLLTDIYGRGSAVKPVPVNDAVFVSAFNNALTVELTAAGVEAMDAQQVEAFTEHATVQVCFSLTYYSILYSVT